MRTVSRCSRASAPTRPPPKNRSSRSPHPRCGATASDSSTKASTAISPSRSMPVRSSIPSSRRLIVPAPTAAEDGRWYRRTGPLISQLAGGVAVGIGVLIARLLASSLPSRGTTLLLGSAAVGAIGRGVLLVKSPEAIPVPYLDVMLVATDVLLVVLSRLLDPETNPLANAFPGIYLMIGMIIFAVRGPWTTVGHTLALGASYAGVLIIGPDVVGPQTRWALLM